MPTLSKIGGERTVLYSQQEAADELGVSVRTIRSYIKRGLLPAVYIRRRCYIWDKNLLQFIRGARSTRNLKAVEPPRFDGLTFSKPPQGI